MDLFVGLTKNIYLCTAFERNACLKQYLFGTKGSLGEWLKPPVC